MPTSRWRAPPGTLPPRPSGWWPARSHLDAGVLALREPGSPDHESRDLGPADGLPRITTAGRFLSPPGRYFPGLAREVDEGGLVEAALEELAWSGAWVKLIGDSPLGGDGITRTFTDAALAQVTAAVHGAGGRVSVHCTVPEVISGALDAGVDSLEHGSFMTLDLLPVLRQADVTWVPTCSINDAVRGLVRNVGYSESAIRHVETCLDAQPEVIRQAVADGVRVLAGTDAGMVPHGMVRREIELLIAAGVPVEAALGAGSWTARSWLGLPLVEEGAPADLVAYREDPRDDPAVLAVPAVIILDGELLVPASV